MTTPQKTQWKKAGENLIKVGETFYLRVRIDGKLHVKSLKTNRLDIAKMKRQDEIARLKSQCAMPSAPETDGTVRTLVKEFMVTLDKPELKRSSVQVYNQNAAELLKLPDVRPAKITPEAARKWFVNIADHYSPRRANQILSVARWFFQWCIERRVCSVDPTEKFRRLPVARDILVLPSPEEFTAVVDNIRAQKGMYAEEAGNFVEFLAFSGMRLGEMPGLTWGHVGEESIRVVGGETGTKNRRERVVPIIPAMADLLSRMHRGVPGQKVFSIKCVKNALANACERVGCAHVSHHDLRHLFATVCIESGVDIPTVSRWLGHLDGGILAMKTYGHLRDHHSKAAAAKVKFG